MFATIREATLLKVRALLAVLWGMLLVSLVFDPFDIANAEAMWDVRLFWTLIAAAPAFILIAGHEGWRRICPLSFLSQLPRYLGRQRPDIFPKDGWIAKHHLFLQFGLLSGGVCARALFINSDRLLLGVLLTVIIGAAIGIGWRYSGKAWCQYFCPIAPVQKFFSAPGGIFESAPHRSAVGIPKSMCRTAVKSGPDERACVGCRSHCADVDLEQNYWRELFKPGQALIYYGYPGILLGFFGFQAYRHGGLAAVLDGSWVAQTSWAHTSLRDGVAALLIFALAIIAVVGVLSQAERAWARYRKQAGVAYERSRHEVFAVTVLCSFLGFYYFGQASFAWLIAPEYRVLGYALIAGAGLFWCYRSLQRSHRDYQQEVMAQRLKKQLERLLAAGSDVLRKVLGNRKPQDLEDREVYWVGKTLNAYSSKSSATLYQTLLKPLLVASAEGPAANDVELLATLKTARAALGVSDEDHHMILKRLREITGCKEADNVPLEDTLKAALFQRVLERFPQIAEPQRLAVLRRLNMSAGDAPALARELLPGMALDLTFSDGRRKASYRASIVRSAGQDAWVVLQSPQVPLPFKAGALVTGYCADVRQQCAYSFFSRLKRKHLDRPGHLLIQIPSVLANAERRQFVRTALSVKATLTPLADDGLDDPSVVGDCLDLGAGGGCFSVPKGYSFKPEQRVQVDLSLADGEQISSSARVIGIDRLELADQRHMQRIALQFVEMHDGDHATISRTVFHHLSRILVDKGALGEPGWSKARVFVVDRAVDEGGQVRSFYLKPRDGKPLPPFKPGQFLTFQLGIGARGQLIRRCYSLSDAPNADYYRVSIKRVAAPKDQLDAPPGLSSNFFHQRVRKGMLLELMQPAGGFFLDDQDRRSVVLIGGGIGITPVLSMLNHLTEGGLPQAIHLFLGFRNRSEHVFKDHLDAVAAQHPQVRLSICYSEPAPEDQIQRDYQHKGRVTADLIAATVGTLDCHFYMCGPASFMQAISQGLIKGGATESDVRFEAFGPASVDSANREALPIKRDARVHFATADQVCTWSDKPKTLLELAEQGGLVLPFGCRVGNCHACAIEIKSGEVAYLKKAEPPPEPGMCLPCIAVPKTDLVLVEPA